LIGDTNKMKLAILLYFSRRHDCLARTSWRGTNEDRDKVYSAKDSSVRLIWSQLLMSY